METIQITDDGTTVVENLRVTFDEEITETRTHYEGSMNSIDIDIANAESHIAEQTVLKTALEVRKVALQTDLDLLPARTEQ